MNLKKRVVMLLTGSRILLACMVAGFAFADYWTVVLALFTLAFLTDMVDGALARYWQVTSPSGARLDQRADALLTGFALVGVILAGWPRWIFPVLVVAFLVTQPLEKRLRGKWLTALVLAAPCVNLTLTAAFAVTFARQSLHVPVLVLVLFTVLVSAMIAAFKSERIDAYCRAAADRGNQAA